jgi:predicted acetyltransferase
MFEVFVVDPSQPEMEVFLHLLQLYEYEFSDITKLEVNRQGLYTNAELQKHLDEKSCKPILLRYNKKWAGLAVVNMKGYLDDDPHVRDMAEFFVMKIYRHRHLGQKFALALFNLFPGKWEIRQLPAAKAARSFWLKVIDRLTNHHLIDQFIEHSRWKGYIQTFEIKP